ncbi:RNA polymerase sigma factor [Paenibacillus sp. J2TS4]|nr:RNA polymerase sigma factor [Paenibacillus sp. J2TS4]
MDIDYLRYASRMDAYTLDELMNDYGQDIWNYAYFITKNRAQADDISQEVFLKAYRHISSFRGECPVKSWLLKITFNLCINYKRSAFFRKVTLRDWIRPSETHRSAEDDYIDQMMSDEIWKTILRLPAKFREVLILDIQHAMSLQEMADLLGISMGTVKSRLHRARAKVSAMLKEGDNYETI